MFKGIRNLTERDRLAQRVVDLEKQVEALKAEARRSLGQSTFREFSREFHLDSNVRDHVVARVVDEFAPMFEPHILSALKQVGSSISRDSHMSPQFAGGCYSDMRDLQVEVHLPPLTTSFRVMGVYQWKTSYSSTRQSVVLRRIVCLRP
jgi:hypothetical protein